MHVGINRDGGYRTGYRGELYFSQKQGTAVAALSADWAE
jgi:hypothetical protein